VAILEGEGFALGFDEGGHRKRLISYSPTLIFSLLHDLSGFSLDLDLNGGEKKLDLEVLGCFFLILLYL
jgi:hypothetical protein